MVTLLLCKKPIVKVPVLSSANLENPFAPPNPLFTKISQLDLKREYDDAHTVDPFNIVYLEHLSLPSDTRGQLAAVNGALDSQMNTIAILFNGSS